VRVDTPLILTMLMVPLLRCSSALFHSWLSSRVVPGVDGRLRGGSPVSREMCQCKLFIYNCGDLCLRDYGQSFPPCSRYCNREGRSFWIARVQKRMAG